jgi:hypothetical protein
MTDDRTESTTEGGQPADIPHLTVAEAARRAGVNERTIRRRLQPDENGRRALPNAHQVASGAWMIPESDLVEAGFELATESPAMSTTEPDNVHDSTGQDDDQGEPDDDRPLTWRERALVAEAQLALKDDVIRHAETSITALFGELEVTKHRLAAAERPALTATAAETVGTSAQVVPEASKPTPEPTAPHRRRWWQRGESS